MGLDQYAYVAAKAGAMNEYYSQSGSLAESTVSKPREIAYWRKHPNLQGWMRRLWEAKGQPNDSDQGFNGDELELTWEDIDQLEHDIKSGAMAGLETTGFFFGNPADDIYRDADLEFVRNARAELFLGLRVFYNSSW
jgi:hypothetical protein